MPTFRHANVLGVKVSAINIPLALETIDTWIKNREHHYVTITGVHGVMESQRDEKIRDIHNRAGMVTPDGMPLVWVNHWQGNREVSRVYGPDLMLAVCEKAPRPVISTSSTAAPRACRNCSNRHWSSGSRTCRLLVVTRPHFVN